MSHAIPDLVLRAHVEGNHIVLDEPFDLPSGIEVTVHIQRSEPTPGSIEAVRRSLGRRTAPTSFNIEKVSREEIYD